MSGRASWSGPALAGIMEFYGATEGNVGLINLDSKPGAIGRVPPHLAKRFNIQLVQFDMEPKKRRSGTQTALH
jgi:hypothetical protein